MSNLPENFEIQRKLSEDDYEIERELIDPEVASLFQRYKKWIFGIPITIILVVLGVIGFRNYNQNQYEMSLSENYAVMSKAFEDFQETLKFNYSEDRPSFPKEAVTIQLLNQQEEELESLRQQVPQRFDTSRESEELEQLEIAYRTIKDQLNDQMDKVRATTAINNLFQEPVIIGSTVSEHPIPKRGLSVENINNTTVLMREPNDPFWVVADDMQNLAKSQQALLASIDTFFNGVYTIEDGREVIDNTIYSETIAQVTQQIERVLDPELRQELYLQFEPVITAVLDRSVEKMYNSNTGLPQPNTSPEAVDEAIVLVDALRNFIVQARYLNLLEPVSVAIQSAQAQANVEAAYQRAIEEEEARTGFVPQRDNVDWYDATTPEIGEDGIQWNTPGVIEQPSTDPNSTEDVPGPIDPNLTTGE